MVVWSPKNPSKDNQSLKAWAEEHPKVLKWANSNWPNDESSRANYVWHLRECCEALKIEPYDLLSLIEVRSPIYPKLRDHLIALSHTRNRKAFLEKAAVTSFVSAYNDTNQAFHLNVKMQKKEKYSRDEPWGPDKYRLALNDVHRKYRPLLTLAVMTGMGRREMIYLNEHFREIKDVEGVKEAVRLSGIPERKQNPKKWTLILPRKEFEEFAKNAPLRTFGLEKRPSRLITADDISGNFENAVKKAGIYEPSVSTHQARRIFKTVGASPEGGNVPLRILDMNLNHTDPLHYDEGLNDFKQRAKALIPLWEYLRRGGPATASSEEVTKLKQKLEEEKKLREEQQKQIDGILAYQREHEAKEDLATEQSIEKASESTTDYVSTQIIEGALDETTKPTKRVRRRKNV